MLEEKLCLMCLVQFIPIISSQYTTCFPWEQNRAISYSRSNVLCKKLPSSITVHLGLSWLPSTPLSFELCELLENWATCERYWDALAAWIQGLEGIIWESCGQFFECNMTIHPNQFVGNWRRKAATIKTLPPPPPPPRKATPWTPAAVATPPSLNHHHHH